MTSSLLSSLLSHRRTGSPKGNSGRVWPNSVDDSGQATAEYGLVILAAAAMAGVLLAWATGNGGVTRLMDAVIDSIIADVTGS